MKIYFYALRKYDALKTLAAYKGAETNDQAASYETSRRVSVNNTKAYIIFRLKSGKESIANLQENAIPCTIKLCDSLDKAKTHIISQENNNELHNSVPYIVEIYSSSTRDLLEGSLIKTIEQLKLMAEQLLTTKTPDETKTFIKQSIHKYQNENELGIFTSCMLKLSNNEKIMNSLVTYDEIGTEEVVKCLFNLINESLIDEMVAAIPCCELETINLQPQVTHSNEPLSANTSSIKPIITSSSSPTIFRSEPSKQSSPPSKEPPKDEREHLLPDNQQRNSGCCLII